MSRAYPSGLAELVEASLFFLNLGSKEGLPFDKLKQVGFLCEEMVR